MDHSGETYPPCPTRKFPGSLLESRDRFRRQAPLRLLVIREAEPQEFPFPWSSHRTLLAVHSKLELRHLRPQSASWRTSDEQRDAAPHVAVIRISGEPMSAPLQLLIQFVEYDVRYPLAGTVRAFAAFV